MTLFPGRCTEITSDPQIGRNPWKTQIWIPLKSNLMNQKAHWDYHVKMNEVFIHSSRNRTESHITKAHCSLGDRSQSWVPAPQCIACRQLRWFGKHHCQAAQLLKGVSLSSLYCLYKLYDGEAWHICSISKTSWSFWALFFLQGRTFHLSLEHPCFYERPSKLEHFILEKIAMQYTIMPTLVVIIKLPQLKDTWEKEPRNEELLRFNWSIAMGMRYWLD